MRQSGPRGSRVRRTCKRRSALEKNPPLAFSYDFSGGGFFLAFFQGWVFPRSFSRVGFAYGFSGEVSEPPVFRRTISLASPTTGSSPASSSST